MFWLIFSRPSSLVFLVPSLDLEETLTVFNPLFLWYWVMDFPQWTNFSFPSVWHWAEWSCHNVSFLSLTQSVLAQKGVCRQWVFVECLTVDWESKPGTSTSHTFPADHMREAVRYRGSPRRPGCLPCRLVEACASDRRLPEAWEMGPGSLALALALCYQEYRCGLSRVGFADWTVQALLLRSYPFSWLKFLFPVFLLLLFSAQFCMRDKEPSKGNLDTWTYLKSFAERWVER